MSEDIQRRFSRLVSRVQDPTLLILKGHLLIEEQLAYFLDKAARVPSELTDARLTFAQKLQVVRALSGMNSWQLDFAKALNSIRNSLAHHADVDGLEYRIDKLLRQFDKAVPVKLTRRQRIAVLRGQIAFVCGSIRGFADGYYAFHGSRDQSHASPAASARRGAAGSALDK